VRCSQLRPKWRTTGRVWVTHRRTLLGWITRTAVSNPPPEETIYVGGHDYLPETHPGPNQRKRVSQF
jgi:hypothetical protein